MRTCSLNFGTERHTTVKVRESDTVWHRFTFSLSTSRYGPPNGNPQQPVTIPLVVTHRGGTTTEDYEGIPSSVTFAVGESVTSFRMRAIPDGRRETGEGLRLGLRPAAGGGAAGRLGSVRNDRVRGPGPAPGTRCCSGPNPTRPRRAAPPRGCRSI